jgi:hypothetical protein
MEVRPTFTQGISGWLMRRMPPVESAHLRPRFLAPTRRQELKSVLSSLSYGLPLITLAVCLEPSDYRDVVVAMASCSVFGIGPWLASAYFDTQWPITVYGVVLVAALVVGARWIMKDKKRYLWNISLEECEFREGAENWTAGQRAKSCFIFALMHFRIPVIPVLVLWTHSIMGAVLMHEYLSVYRKTGSRQQALDASTTVHWLGNEKAVGAMLTYTTIASAITIGKLLLTLG